MSSATAAPVSPGGASQWDAIDSFPIDGFGAPTSATDGGAGSQMYYINHSAPGVTAVSLNAQPTAARVPPPLPPLPEAQPGPAPASQPAAQGYPAQQQQYAASANFAQQPQHQQQYPQQQTQQHRLSSPPTSAVAAAAAAAAASSSHLTQDELERRYFRQRELGAYAGLQSDLDAAFTSAQRTLQPAPGSAAASGGPLGPASSGAAARVPFHTGVGAEAYSYSATGGGGYDASVTPVSVVFANGPHHGPRRAGAPPAASAVPAVTSSSYGSGGADSYGHAPNTSAAALPSLARGGPGAPGVAGGSAIVVKKQHPYLRQQATAYGLGGPGSAGAQAKSRAARAGGRPASAGRRGGAPQYSQHQQQMPPHLNPQQQAEYEQFLQYQQYQQFLMQQQGGGAPYGQPSPQQQGYDTYAAGGYADDGAPGDIQSYFDFLYGGSDTGAASAEPLALASAPATGSPASQAFAPPPPNPATHPRLAAAVAVVGPTQTQGRFVPGEPTFAPPAGYAAGGGNPRPFEPDTRASGAAGPYLDARVPGPRARSPPPLSAAPRLAGVRAPDSEGGLAEQPSHNALLHAASAATQWAVDHPHIKAATAGAAAAGGDGVGRSASQQRLLRTGIGAGLAGSSAGAGSASTAALGRTGAAGARGSAPGRRGDGKDTPGSKAGGGSSDAESVAARLRRARQDESMRAREREWQRLVGGAGVSSAADAGAGAISPTAAARMGASPSQQLQSQRSQAHLHLPSSPSASYGDTDDGARQQQQQQQVRARAEAEQWAALDPARSAPAPQAYLGPQQPAAVAAVIGDAPRGSNSGAPGYALGTAASAQRAASAGGAAGAGVGSRVASRSGSRDGRDSITGRAAAAVGSVAGSGAAETTEPGSPGGRSGSRDGSGADPSGAARARPALRSAGSERPVKPPSASGPRASAAAARSEADKSAAARKRDAILAVLRAQREWETRHRAEVINDRKAQHADLVSALKAVDVTGKALTAEQLRQQTRAAQEAVADAAEQQRRATAERRLEARRDAKRAELEREVAREAARAELAEQEQRKFEELMRAMRDEKEATVRAYERERTLERAREVDNIKRRFINDRIAKVTGAPVGAQPSAGGTGAVPPQLAALYFKPLADGTSPRANSRSHSRLRSPAAGSNGAAGVTRVSAPGSAPAGRTLARTAAAGGAAVEGGDEYAYAEGDEYATTVATSAQPAPTTSAVQTTEPSASAAVPVAVPPLSLPTADPAPSASAPSAASSSSASPTATAVPVPALAPVLAPASAAVNESIISVPESARIETACAEPTEVQTSRVAYGVDPGTQR